MLADFGLPYEQKKRSAATQRDALLAQNAYSRFLSTTRGSRQLADIDRSMSRGVEKVGAAYGRRGLRNSGIFNRAQTDYATGWMQQRQSVNEQLAELARQLDLGDQTAWSNYYSTEADAEAEKNAAILAAAAQLNDAKPFLGV